MEQVSPETIRILNVDDECADHAVESLERIDDRFAVDVVGSAAAIDRLERSQYDCVVSEYDMSDVNGIELLESVRAEWPDLPFVLYTGDGSEAVASEAIAADVTAYLAKSDDEDQDERLANRILDAVECWHVRRDYRAICESVPDGVVVHDPRDGAFVDMNDQFAEMLGYDREALLDAGFGAVVSAESPHDLEDARRRIRAAAESGPRTFEWPCITRDGETLWTEMHLAPVRLRGRDWVLAVIRDVTDRRERGRELKSYEAVVEAIDDAVYVLDGDGTIRHVNESYAEMKGVPKTDLVGTSIERWADDEAVEHVRGVFAEIERGEREAGKLEYEFRTVDGERIPAELRFTVIEFPDGSRGRVGVIRDVRERTERERELERRNERLDDFASIVSHDLRNPLNVLEGSLELAAETGEPREFDRCRRAIDRMNQLVDDLLSLARSTDVPLEREPVSLATVAEQSWETVETGGATLETTTDSVVVADDGHLRRLFENLFRNSVEHGSTSPRSETHEDSVEHGSTSPRSETHESDPGPDSPFDQTGPDQRVAGEFTRGGSDGTDEGVAVTVGELPDGFYVADDGVGIPVAERDRVFESGYSNAPARTGLGLSIVSEVADAHGWSVAVTDGVDGGTRFEFTGVECLESADNTTVSR